jgi:diguanylate cyclase (GGDEF)-like protein
VAIVLFAIVSLRIARYRHPELALIAVWGVGQLAAAGAVALAHGPLGYLLIVPVIPMTLAGAVFPVRVGAMITAVTAVVIAALGFGLDTHEVLSTPPVLLLPIVVLVVVSMSAAIAGSLDVTSRRIAATDHLTGLPNRFALQPRISELVHQATATGERVAVVAVDVDHLKTVNDEHGHVTGDAVLREVARRLRECLAPFDSIYRFGGEEFVALLAGYDLTTARAAADRMRNAVRGSPIEGLAVTVSIGVAVPSLGERFDFQAAFARADAALYDAKAAGRDAVRADTVSGATAPADAADAVGAARRRRADLVSAQPPEITPGAPAPPGWTELEPAADPDARSWLIGDALEREHMLELGARMRPLLVRGNVAAFVEVAASGPWFGWAVLGPPIVGALNFQWIAHHVGRFRRPEYPLALGWLALQTSIALGFALSHGQPLFALPLFVLMVPGTAAVFPPRAVALGLAATALLMTAVALGLDAAAVRQDAAILGFPLVLLAGSGLMGLTLGRSALGYRTVATVDQLTGSLNRAALGARANELEAQSALNRSQVAMALGDVDAFKAINDGHGHVVGDRVLAQLALRLRTSLRTFESVYRLGGEEFMVLLPGVDDDEAAAVAERLRHAVGDESIEGHAVTMSFGVAASPPGVPFDYQTVFDRADAALLQAKRSGRDRVVRAPAAE